LTVQNFGGDVVVRTWPRDAVRVQARHGRKLKVNISTTPAGVVVRSQGTPASIDYEISVPSWMPIRVTGTYAFISVEGAQSEVYAETTRGDVLIKGGTGAVTAKSISGEVVIEGANGRIMASSVNEDVRITGAGGDITAESSNGDISLSQVRSENIEVSTINGNVSFAGAPAERARYRVTTHNGNITVDVPPASNVTFNVRTYEGRFSSTLTLQGPPRAEVRRGRRTAYILGNGSAEMDLESFGGTIRIGPPAPRAKEKEKSK
jgi:DUF4097 and DUF4098 domain-containing protein YvlB